MDNQKALDKVVEAIKNSNNVLVTINRNPDVDQIAAAIALSFVLEKLEKFTTTIFSGQIPAAAEFLDPEKTFSSNMETLRDFVISIDKGKVDRLRYKQEGDSVRVYLTPYRTTLSQDDLEFENGNYNIDLVITIGTVSQEDMDNAIVGAIRVLHDATVVAINTGGLAPSYANISWADPEEIAYCEMVADLAEILGESEIDEHTATALLTGIVASTDQFKNMKANPKVMQLAAKLMSFGANQQLISIKLEEGYKIDREHPIEPQPRLSDRESIDEVSEHISQGVEATTNAMSVVDSDLARSRAENEYNRISGDENATETGDTDAPTPAPDDIPAPPPMPPMPEGAPPADWQSLPPMPAPPGFDISNMPMPPIPVPPPMAVPPAPTGNVMNDLASYAPPEVQPPTLPINDTPTESFFGVSPVPENSPAPEDTNDQNPNNNEQQPEEPSGYESQPLEGSTPDLDALRNAASQAADSAGLDTNPFMTTSPPIVDGQTVMPQSTDELPQTDIPAPPPQMPEEVPTNQFRIPGQ